MIAVLNSYSLPYRSKFCNLQCCVIFKVFSDSGDEYIHAARHEKAIFFPNLLKESLPFHDLIRVLDKELQDLIFFVG